MDSETSPVNLAKKEMWEGVAEKQHGRSFLSYESVFHKLFADILPIDGEKTFIEIGASPGRNMVYFNRVFKYQVTGLDYVDNFDECQQNMAQSKVNTYSLINQDLFEYKPEQQYDVVFSSGFIEHFDDWKKAMDAIQKFVKPGGYVITSCPHYRGFHYIIRKLLTPDIFSYHNLEMMKPSAFKDYYQNKQVEPLYCNYFGLFDYWDQHAYKYPLRRLVTRVLEKISSYCKGVNIPNRFFSPHVLCVVKMKNSEK